MSYKKTGKPTGRPLKYTPEQLQEKIDQYFIECEEKKKFANIASLAVYLDVARETIYELKNNESKGFSNIIKKARLKIESLACEKLNNNNSIGAMFYLKSIYSYKDKSEIEIKHKGNVNVSLMRYESGKVEGNVKR